MSVRIVIWPVHLSPSHWRTLVFKPTSPFWSFKELKNPSQLVFSSEYELQSGARSAFRCLSRVQPVRLHAFRTLPGLWEPPDLPFPCCLAVLFQTLRQRKLFVIGEYIRDIRERGENLLLLTLEHNHTYVGVSDIFVTGKNIFHFLPLCVTFKKYQFQFSSSPFLEPDTETPRYHLSCAGSSLYMAESLVWLLRLGCVWIWIIATPLLLTHAEKVLCLVLLD